MPKVSQNIIQNASTKQHRPFPDISRKIIAFDEIAATGNIKSARKITALLQVPNSTMQSWRDSKILKNAVKDEEAKFFASSTGISFLHRLVLAIMYNNKCGASGICGVQETLRHAGLDRHVASSIGSLQEFWIRCEDCILDFGKKWEQKLAKRMSPKKITVILDEMFRKRMPCLVAIEAVSNYILLERFTENRTADTWRKELENVTKDLPIEIGQITAICVEQSVLLQMSMVLIIVLTFFMDS